MVYGGKLDLRDVAGSFRRWPDLLVVALFYYGCVVLTCLRWHILLRAEEISIRFRDTFALTMIGLLFNTLIPSSVGGDVVKGYYLTTYAGGKKTRALTTMIIDRGLGMLALLIAASASILWNLPAVRESRPVALFCAVVTAITVLGIGAFAIVI